MHKTITCPYCGHHNEIQNAELYAGKKIRIPCGNNRCGQKFEFTFESTAQSHHTEIIKKNVYGQKAILILFENEFHKETIYHLKTGEEIFGRKSEKSGKSGQIESTDNTISRNHFKITGIKEKRNDNIKFILEDLRSTNSVFLNGLALKSILKPVLQQNDKIEIGNSRMEFRYTDLEEKSA